MSLWNELKANEIHYFEKMGWVEAGGTPGTHKLSAKGLAEFDRLLEAFDSKLKVMTKLKLAGNADTDLNTLF